MKFRNEHFVTILGAESKDGINVVAMEEGKENLLATIERVTPDLPSVDHFEDLVE